MSLRIYFALISLILLANILYGRAQMIHGGPIMSLDRYGYQAVVLIVIKNAVVQICGGTIVSQFHVITTASCFANAPNEYYDIQVRVGSIHILNGGNLYNVSKVERHPAYNKHISTHNLAVVFITKGIEFSPVQQTTAGGVAYLKRVQDIPLGDQFIKGGDKATISGYSFNSSVSTTSDLQNMYTYSMSYFPCLDYFRNSVISVELIDDEMLCIRNNPQSLFCDILDGSPVVMERKLVGVFLYRDGNCNDHKVPIIFTRIANNLLWLQTIIHGSRFSGTNDTCIA